MSDYIFEAALIVSAVYCLDLWLLRYAAFRVAFWVIMISTTICGMGMWLLGYSVLAHFAKGLS